MRGQLRRRSCHQLLGRRGAGARRGARLGSVTCCRKTATCLRKGGPPPTAGEASESYPEGAKNGQETSERVSHCGTFRLHWARVRLAWSLRVGRHITGRRFIAIIVVVCAINRLSQNLAYCQCEPPPVPCRIPFQTAGHTGGGSGWLGQHACRHGDHREGCRTVPSGRLPLAVLITYSDRLLRL